jgi:thymidylate synthase
MAYNLNATRWNALSFIRMYKDVMEGREVRPRGQLIKEAEDYVISLHMGGNPCTSFKARSFNLKYAKAEFLWYLRGDPYDTFIENYATMWPKLKQPGGFYYSNYGQYLFGEKQIEWVLDELMRDKDSRRASCVLLKNHHMFPSNKDMVCTYSLNFRIRDNRLNMSVNMRSNDAVFGTTNDVFSFSMVYELVFAYLRFRKYDALERGQYHHKVDSLHIYQRHFDMVREIIRDSMDGYWIPEIPEVSSLDEATFMLDYHEYQDQGYIHPQPNYEFMRWLADLQ